MYTENLSPFEHGSSEPGIETYLAKLGLDNTIPHTAEGLARVQNAHLQRIPYSTIHQFHDGPEPIEPSRIIARIAETGHGGYCFGLNSALFALLVELGFEAQRHLAAIRRHASSTAATPPPTVNHMTITVHNLPTTDNPNGIWLTDVGMGDGPYSPLPLRAGTYREEEFEYTLEQPPESGGWRFLHHTLGSFFDLLFDTSAGDTSTEALNDAHLKLAGSATSRFTRNLIVEIRPDAGTTDTLINCELQRRCGQALTTSELMEKGEWFSALNSLFGLSLKELSEGQKDDLWHKVASAHLARKRSH